MQQTFLTLPLFCDCLVRASSRHVCFPVWQMTKNLRVPRGLSPWQGLGAESPIHKKQKIKNMEHASSLTGEQKISRQEAINSLPLAAWDGPVRIINSQDEVQSSVELLSQSAILGFDTETRPAFRKGEKHPVSLVQLAGEDTVVLFQLNQIGLPVDLCELLANPNIIKTGVGLTYDLRMLRELRDFAPKNFVDLAPLARQRGISQGGLRGLAATLLDLRISKSARTSKWDAQTLSPQQIRYAATDAWISREIYLALNKRPISSGTPRHQGENLPQKP